MLVLSRGLEDKIVFPNLDITIEILRVAGNRVSVGIDAPKDVRVLRHELLESLSAQLQQADDHHAKQSVTHQLRNQLNSAHIAMGLVEKLLNVGKTERALRTLRKAISAYDTLDTAAGEPDDVGRFEENGVAPRALLVEDDANESELLAGYLEMSGFEVDTAVDGIQAMVHLGKSDKPDVVLMDMHMPRMNGPQTIRAIRDTRDLDGIRIFGVSGAKPEEIPVEVGPVGVDRWFSKPIRPQELVDGINELLASAS